MASILRPRRNVWRIERANRAAVLVDGAEFFQAVREAFANARRSIYVLGWDIDSRTRLVGENTPDDGMPATLAEFLTELVKRRPELKVNLLLWDYSLIYASEREPFPRLSLQWRTPDQISLCLDNLVPFGCSQHQKIIVVDNALAFSGGLDLTIRRWDTSDHRANNPDRVDPSGKPFAPFHDVQMMVDGAAAQALAEVACKRWATAAACQKPDNKPQGDPWPESTAPHFTDVDVGISRTEPGNDETAKVREAEALFVDSIAHAEHSIYIENQYLTSPIVAQALAKRLRQRPELKLLVVAPREHESWIESKTMRNGRIRFWETVLNAGGDRVRLMYPHVEDGKEGTQTMIHSKVMVIDDRFLRVGSANMNNRSMGADSECDLAIEARNDAERCAIVGIRNRLIGEHCGVSADAVASCLDDKGRTLASVADNLSGDGHMLKPIQLESLDASEFFEAAEEFTDPKRPIVLSDLWPRLLHSAGLAKSAAAWALVFALLLMAGLTIVWHVSPLEQWTTPDAVRDWLKNGAGEPWAGALVIGMFVVGGLIAFPVLIMIAATAAAFGPWLGFLYAVLGVLASALVTYGIGAQFGRQTLSRLLGPRFERARAKIERQGVLAVAAVRVVPAAPFTFVNLALGASGIAVTDYAAGTLLGMLPGLIALSILGHRIVAVISDPSLFEVSLLMLGVLGWIMISVAVQLLMSRLRGAKS